MAILCGLVRIVLVNQINNHVIIHMKFDLLRKNLMFIAVTLSLWRVAA